MHGGYTDRDLRFFTFLTHWWFSVLSLHGQSRHVELGRIGIGLSCRGDSFKTESDIRILFTFLGNGPEPGARAAQHRWRIVPASEDGEGSRSKQEAGEPAPWHPSTLAPTLAQVSPSPSFPLLAGTQPRQKQEAAVILITKLYLVNTLD